MNLTNLGKGKGTYAVGVLTILWAVWGWWQGSLDPATAQQTLLVGLGVLGFRRAMVK